MEEQVIALLKKLLDSLERDEQDAVTGIFSETTYGLIEDVRIAIVNAECSP